MRKLIILTTTALAALFSDALAQEPVPIASGTLEAAVIRPNQTIRCHLYELQKEMGVEEAHDFLRSKNLAPAGGQVLSSFHEITHNMFAKRRIYAPGVLNDGRHIVHVSDMGQDGRPRFYIKGTHEGPSHSQISFMRGKHVEVSGPLESGSCIIGFEIVINYPSENDPEADVVIKALGNYRERRKDIAYALYMKSRTGLTEEQAEGQLNLERARLYRAIRLYGKPLPFTLEGTPVEILAKISPAITREELLDLLRVCLPEGRKYPQLGWHFPLYAPFSTEELVEIGVDPFEIDHPFVEYR